MPDWGDLSGSYPGNELFTFCFLALVFIFCICGFIIDKIAEHNELRRRKRREEFYDALAESDLRTTFTSSEEE